jgi:hypothetical protein
MTAAPWFMARPLRRPGALRRLARATALAATATVLAAPAPTLAADGFVAPSSLGALAGTLPENPYTAAARAPQVVSTADGTSYAAWIAPGTGAAGTALLASRAPGGTWTTQEIAPTLRSANTVPLGLAADGTLTALVVDPTTNALTALTRPPGGTFGNGVQLSPAGGQIAGPTLAVNSAGAAVAAFRFSGNSGTSWMTGFAHRTSGGTWDLVSGALAATDYAGPAQFPTPTFQAGTLGTVPSWVSIDPPSVAMNAAGKFVIGVTIPSLATGGTLQPYVFVSTSTIGAFSGAKLVGGALPTTHASRVRVALSGAGAIAATWLHASLTGSPWEANSGWLTSAPAGTTTFSVGSLPGMVSQTVPIAFDGANRFTFAWVGGYAAFTGRLWFGAGTPGNPSLSATSQLSPSADFVWAPSVATDAAGNRLVLWANDSSGAIQGRFSPAGSEVFNDTRTVATLGQGPPTAPNAAFDGEGNAAAAWTRLSSAGSVTQATGFDTVAPAFAQLTIPSGGTAGTPLAFSAAATDRWSTPKLAWSFGDGGTDSAGSPTHGYGSPNSYTASVTATDDVGNVTTRTGSLVITAVPPVDRDGDATFADRDCNDEDPRVKPGAHDVPGNKVDENCDGKDAAYGVLATTVRIGYTQNRNRLAISALAVRGVRVGDRIKVRCTGAGCTRKPNVERRVKQVSKKAEYSLVSLVRGLRLRPGARLTIAVSRDEFTTRITTYKVRSGKAPKESTDCQLPGTKTIVSCS